MTPIVDLTGKRGLVVGIANESSIAYGCARAFRAAGADLAVTYLNAKADRYVRPLAEALAASIFVPCNVRVAGCRENPKSGKARRPAGLATDQVPSRNKS